jgi:hypothetical protein
MPGDRLFASYAGEDRSRVLATVENLARRGHEVWFDRNEMRVSDDLVAGIDAGLADSKHVILFTSASYFAKSWTKAEYSAAVAMALAESNRLLFIVRLDDAPLPPLLAARLYVRWDSAEAVAGKIDDALGQIGYTPDVEVPAQAGSPRNVNWQNPGEVPDYLIDVLVERLLEVIGDLRGPNFSGATAPVRQEISDELSFTMNVSTVLIRNDSVVEELRHTWKILGILRKRAHGLARELHTGGLGVFETSYAIRLEELQIELDDYMKRMRNQMSVLCPRLIDG